MNKLMLLLAMPEFLMELGFGLFILGVGIIFLTLGIVMWRYLIK